MSDRVVTEDALKHCHECEYQGRSATTASLAGALGIGLADAAEVFSELVDDGYATSRGRNMYDLTDRGRQYARRIVRAHRIYESALARDSGFPEADWHAQAELKEHLLTRDEVERLSERLGHPRWDPHGDPIPTVDGDLPAVSAREISSCPVGWEGRISHVEDEPEAVYRRIIGLGLVAGMRVRIESRDESGCRINADGRIVMLERAMGPHLHVAEMPPGETFDERLVRLTDLKPGGTARVVRLGPGCRGAERNRLLDLGVVPGSDIEIDLVSPSGNPTAYRIRGASIALRREQADTIYVHIAEAAA